MPLPAIKLGFFRLVTAGLFASSIGYAANQIGDNRVQIDTPLSAADVAALKALPKWPDITVRLAESATAETFASLAQASDIRDVDLAESNHITDLSALASLPHLQTLELRNLRGAQKTPVNLGPLAGRAELVKVNCYGTRVTNTEALAKCPQLRDVSFYMSDVDSIRFLESTPQLRRLSLYGFKHTFADYTPVAGLSKLRELNIYMNTQATDDNLAELKKLTSLRVIHMANSKQTTSLDFLANCTELVELDAKWSTKLADIRAVARMPYLEKVDLSSAPIDDLTPLSDKIYLERLNLDKTKITDLAPISRSSHLEQLDVAETAVKDLTPLAGMRVMQNLNISKTGVTDLSPLRAMRKLSVLNIQGTAVTDLSPLQELEGLRHVMLSRTVSQAEIDALKAALPTLRVTN